MEVSGNFTWDVWPAIEIPCTPPLALEATFACGQAFRWQKEGEAYIGVVAGMPVRVSPHPQGFLLQCPPGREKEPLLREYFDLSYDYAGANAALSTDAVLSPMVECCRGMRLLNQPLWECLISFIISANNNILRISGIIERISAQYGLPVGMGQFSFPTPEALAAADEAALRACGLGYRAPSVLQAAQRVARGYPLEALRRLGYEAAKKELMTFRGVGEKVADCVLLFSCGYRDSFPVDVWIARAMGNYYPTLPEDRHEIGRFARETYGPYAGLAQQYMFHYARTRKEKGK